MSGLDKVRHARERGMILKLLQEEYSGRMTRVADLAGALDLRGYSMTGESIQFSLNYLYEEAYVQVTRARDTAGFRSDRANDLNPDLIVFAKLTPRGIRLIDGDEPSNAGVRF